MGKKKKISIPVLVSILIIVVGGSVLFVGAVSGWFGSSRVVLDAEYYGEGGDFMQLDQNEYEKLIETKKSFIVFVDQGGCTTADRLREYVNDYSKERGIKVYRMMFSELKKSSLHDYVKYYPSVVFISKGKVMNYLRADSDEDADEYNDYETFKEWMNNNL